MSNPWRRGSFPQGRLDAALKADAYDEGFSDGADTRAREIVAALQAKCTHAADVLADQIAAEFGVEE